ncbi:MAG: DUF5916 domain-containing protein [Gemmatimonadota bacterium]
MYAKKSAHCSSALALLLALAGSAGAQSAPAGDGGADRRVAEARAVPGGAITLDGRLDEASWRDAPIIDGFVQKEPVEGAEPSARTEVRIVYDASALYVGARMHEGDPDIVRAPVGRRDELGQADWFLISLDTYLNRRTAVTFGVTAGGTRFDRYHDRDDEDAYDEAFDPVWEARTRTEADGWTAEIRIPFSQLRFTPAADQRWGVNFARAIPQREERSYWVPVPRSVQAWASRFGTLEGLRDIDPARGVELLPYVASDARLVAEPDADDPFAGARSGSVRVGGDLKVGLGPNVTLDATFNPDFGQVEADPAVVNLSAFEVFFPERRPFFTEGSQLFDGGNLFYSRRIGGLPAVPQGGDYVDAPETATILGAAKLTGRLERGTSFGVLGAVTDEERARIWSEEEGFGTARLAPRTWTGVVAGQQEFGADASTASVVFTGVHRELGEEDPLADYLHRSAIGALGRFNLRFQGGTYAVSGQTGYTRVHGSAAALLRTQRSPVHFFQRPDQEHVRVDPTRTALSGHFGSLSVAKNSGRHWLWSLDGYWESPGYEPNDAGSLGNADEIAAFATLTYRDTDPGRWLRNWSLSVSQENTWAFDGVRAFGALRSDARLTLANFWRINVTAWRDFRGQSPTLSRGGPRVGTGRAWVTIAQLLSSTASDTRWNARIYFGESEQGERTMRLSGQVSVRPGPRWQLSVAPNYLIGTDPRQYVARLPGGPAATFGERYVFATTDRTTFLAEIRAAYAVRPDLTVELYAEPFAASGRFFDHGELPEAGSRALRTYGTDGTGVTVQSDGSRTITDGNETFTLSARDFNVRSFRSNAVLRWEWRPGSTLYLVWQQDRFSSTPEGSRVGADDLWDAVTTPGEHRLLVKATYWLPVG